MTTENNKIIAEFMSWDSNESKTVFYEPTDEVQGIDGFTLEKLPFDNWNWLMEVVEKIESINEANDEFCSDYSFTVTNFIQNWTAGFISRENVEIVNVEGLTRKESVYNACLEFIKWYNEQNKV